MLSNIVTIGAQALALFIMMAVGCVLYKTKLIDDKGVESMTNVILYAVTPCLIINALSREFDSALALELGLFVLTALGLMLLLALVAALLFRRSGDFDRPVLRTAIPLSNCGFMGIPLAQAVCGESGVLFASVYVCCATLMQWTYAYGSMVKGERGTWKKIVFSPGTIGFALGILVFVFSVKLPEPLGNAIGMLAQVNSPLAMVIIGAMLARSRLLDSLRDVRVYAVSAMRLVAAPLITLALLPLLTRYMSADASLTALIETSAPVGAVTTMVAAKGGKNAELSGNLVAVSTVLSIVTMPVMIAIGQYLLTRLQ